MSNEHTKPEATDGDRDLAFVRKWIDTDESEGVQRTVLKELNEIVASRLAAVEAEIQRNNGIAFKKEAELREEIAAVESERDALKRLLTDSVCRIQETDGESLLVKRIMEAL